MFDRGDRLPRPSAPGVDTGALLKANEFTKILLEIPFPSPYAIAVADVRAFMNMLRFRSEYAESEEAEVQAFHDFRKEMVDQLHELIKPHPSVCFCGTDGDSMVLASEDADGLLAATIALRNFRFKMLESESLSGCITCGIALHEKDMGREFRGIYPGVTAKKIADRHRRKNRSVAVTKHLLNGLAATNRALFVRSAGESSAQGDVYVSEAPPGMNDQSGLGSLTTDGMETLKDDIAMVGRARDRIVLALDVPTCEDALSLAVMLHEHVGLFKIGLELFHLREGFDLVRRLRELGAEVFLDEKYHDIPSTVARYAKAATRLGVKMFNLHLAGGVEMMRAAVAASREESAARGLACPLVLGVTVLTSINQLVLNNELRVAGAWKIMLPTWPALRIRQD